MSDSSRLSQIVYEFFHKVTQVVALDRVPTSSLAPFKPGKDKKGRAWVSRRAVFDPRIPVGGGDGAGSTESWGTGAGNRAFPRPAGSTRSFTIPLLRTTLSGRVRGALSPPGSSSGAWGFPTHATLSAPRDPPRGGP